MPAARDATRSDAVVVGAGPNGLAAAVMLARAGRPVVVFERADTAGGGTRSAALTLPGFVHDVCAAVHPFAVASPFFRRLPLADHGLALVHSPHPLAHPLDDGSAVVLERSLAATAAALGDDGPAWISLLAPFVERWRQLADDVLGPLRAPRHPRLAAHFGLVAIRAAESLARARFRDVRARALFAGLAAHSMLPLDTRASAAVGLVLAAVGHAGGWPIARGGSQAVADALGSLLRALGGSVVTGHDVKSLHELPAARAILLDVSPRQLLDLGGDRLPRRYRRALARYRYGPGAFKLDWALDGPIPWRARECALAATVHVGGTLEEVVESESAVGRGELSARPFVILVQPSLFDPTRAPAGFHTAWAYCHVPNGSDADMTERIEAQIERFAPGFRRRILARHVMGPSALERWNPNHVGGDMNGGLADLRQMFARPVVSRRPNRTPLAGVHLCSASTPPGGGVHGMCGYWAARSVLQEM